MSPTLEDSPFGGLSSSGLPPGPSAKGGPDSPQNRWKMGKVTLQRETAHRGGKTVIVIKDFAPISPPPSSSRSANASGPPADAAVRSRTAASRSREIRWTASARSSKRKASRSAASRNNVRGCSLPLQLQGELVGSRAFLHIPDQSFPTLVGEGRGAHRAIRRILVRDRRCHR